MFDAEGFTSHCKKWRQFRKLSQLELSLMANISQRHLSYLETGKSQPSREMVARLCDALDIPLRNRNHLFEAAGYTAIYRHNSLEDVDMQPILHALDTMLANHLPLPAVVIDRVWNVVKLNTCAEQLFAFLLSMLASDPQTRQHKWSTPINLAKLSMHPQGLRTFMTNWEQQGPVFKSRLKREALASADPHIASTLNGILAEAGDIHDLEFDAHSAMTPVIPIKLHIHNMQLSLFSTISTFGTPQDVTTDELRIEAFYPLDKETETFFQQFNA